jgi:hypothetical protein
MEDDSPWVYGTQVLEDGQEIHFKLRSIFGKTKYDIEEMPGFILDGDPIIYDGKDFSPTDSILD